ncbi:mitochondrial glyco protein [Heliocybe sulcata]|uniref:Mitochondrial glyco protein n=1 Tax=Heliocybe sulcata TaxID=5364 RepID=A0A5C3MYU2_9AGAM|nr:mitochondrial glyco protein [Heliocybe sulcata]
MSAFRSVRQIAASSSRVSARTTVASSCRSRLLLTAATRLATPASTRAFSVSARALGEAASDVALSQKLQEELKYEKETAVEQEPEFLTTFKSQNIWKIEDASGNDEVTLTRKFGNETIRLVFSIADIQANEAYDEQEEDGETEETEGGLPGPSYPIRCSFSISKSTGPGALNIDTMCQDGGFIVDNLSFYSDAKVGTELSAEMDWKRRGLYIGPQFDTLDVAVQESFEQFLQERGINENLAFFIPEYAEYKEQKEYIKWLENVKQFIEL